MERYIVQPDTITCSPQTVSLSAGQQAAIGALISGPFLTWIYDRPFLGCLSYLDKAFEQGYRLRWGRAWYMSDLAAVICDEANSIEGGAVLGFEGLIEEG